MSRPKNFRKLPDWISAKLKRIPSTSVIAACVQKLTKEGIAAGKFAHLGITIEKGEVLHDKSFMPKYDVGRKSKINAEGEEIVHKDLPMVKKTFVVETPNFGDWRVAHPLPSKGWDALGFGRGGGDRTHDLRLKRPLLYH
jgi:hypothetical protein